MDWRVAPTDRSLTDGAGGPAIEGNRVEGTVVGRKRDIDGANACRTVPRSAGGTAERTRPFVAQLHRATPGCGACATSDRRPSGGVAARGCARGNAPVRGPDRKSTRLNSSH